jgi:hypothetical protein
VESIAAVARVKVSVDGHGVVSHAGRDVVEVGGVDWTVSAGTAASRTPIGDRGTTPRVTVFADLAAAVADG